MTASAREAFDTLAEEVEPDGFTVSKRKVRTMTASAREAFDTLAEEVEPDGFTVSKMFGLPCLKHSNKAIVALLGDGVAFKLGAGTDEHAAAMTTSGADAFDPAKNGRPMKDWVWLPASSADTWPGHAKVAASRLA